MRIRFASVMIPPTVTQSLSRRSASAASGQSTRARSASRTGFSGCAEMNSPIASFSTASSSRLLELARRDRRVGRAAERRARRRRPAAAGVAAVAEVEDRALADLRVLLRLLARGLRLLEHLEHALAASRRSSRSAPHLISASIAFLLTARPSTRSQKSHSELNGAALLARPLDRLDRLVADALDGVQAEADVARSTTT